MLPYVYPELLACKSIIIHATNILYDIICMICVRYVHITLRSAHVFAQKIKILENAWCWHFFFNPAVKRLNEMIEALLFIVCKMHILFQTFDNIQCRMH